MPGTPLSNPEFYKLDPATRVSVMQKFDPEFAKLPPDAQQSIVVKFEGQYGGQAAAEPAKPEPGLVDRLDQYRSPTLDTASKYMPGMGPLINPIGSAVDAAKFLRDHPTLAKIAGGVGGLAAGTPLGPGGMIAGAMAGTSIADSGSQLSQIGTDAAPQTSGDAALRAGGALAEGGVAGVTGAGTVAGAPTALRAAASPIGQGVLAGGATLYETGDPGKALLAGLGGVGFGKLTKVLSALRSVPGAAAEKGGLNSVADWLERKIAQSRIPKGEISATLNPAEVAPMAERMPPPIPRPQPPVRLDQRPLALHGETPPQQPLPPIEYPPAPAAPPPAGPLEVSLSPEATMPPMQAPPPRPGAIPPGQTKLPTTGFGNRDPATGTPLAPRNRSYAPDPSLGMNSEQEMADEIMLFNVVRSQHPEWPPSQVTDYMRTLRSTVEAQ